MFALLLSGVFVVAVSVILVFVVVIVLVVASSGFALVVAFDCWPGYVVAGVVRRRRLFNVIVEHILRGYLYYYYAYTFE